MPLRQAHYERTSSGRSGDEHHGVIAHAKQRASKIARRTSRLVGSRRGSALNGVVPHGVVDMGADGHTSGRAGDRTGDESPSSRSSLTNGSAAQDPDVGVDALSC